MRDINPLNVLEQREVSFPIEHFTKIYYDLPLEKAKRSVNSTVEEISNWIYNHLDGRYYIINDGINNAQESFYYRFEIGFEIPEESTFFSLAYSDQ